MRDDIDSPLVGIDIDAIQDAVEALADAGIEVESVDNIRMGDDGTVRWDMDLRADTRHADINDFE